MYNTMILLVEYIIILFFYIMDSSSSKTVAEFRFSGRIITGSSRPEESVKTTPEQELWLNQRKHHHTYREILAVVSGNDIFLLNNRRFVLHPGDILLLDAKDTHPDGHYTKEPATFWWGGLWTDILRIYLWENGRIAESNTLSMGSFNNFINRIWNDLKTGEKPQAEFELSSLISGLVNNFVRSRGKRNTLYNKFSTTKSSTRFMNQILKHIEEMPSLNCDLNYLARLAGYSTVHFQRKFIHYTGIPFREFMLENRVERYRSLTEKGSCSLKELADSLGFSSVSNLLHWKSRNRVRFHLK